MSDQVTLQETRFLTIPQFCDEHAWPSAQAVRHMIFQNKDGFVDRCVKRIGRRILLDERAVLDWIASH